MGTESKFHLAEIIIMVLTISVPVIWSSLRIHFIFKDFPPHRHVNGNILFPTDYKPPEVERINK